MQMLSEDDLNLRDMTRDELDAAWDLWFDLAQSTNSSDPPYTHGVFAAADVPPAHPAERAPQRASMPGASEPGQELDPTAGDT
jgi:hypothetical protein